MNSALVVTTECPTCGAPLDFSEGSNAIQCLHCRTHLLVTGRKQILSYAVSPKIDEKGAIKRVRLTQRENEAPSRIVKVQLYFIPYYRLTGHDFLWQREAPPSNFKVEGFPSSISHALPGDWETGASSLDLFFQPPSIVQTAIRFLERVLGVEDKKVSPLQSHPTKTTSPATAISVSPADRKRTSNEDDGEAQFRDRYVEKNFIASDLKGFWPYSLGLRPAVLRLELFQRKALEEKGRVVDPAMTPEGALARGMQAADSKNILYRQVMGRVLSVIYFPFWVVEVEQKGESRLQIVDAVSEGVVQSDVPSSAYDLLHHTSAADMEVIGFRPLLCPNCGWDLPAKPEDVIFFCASCEKAWQIRGKYLYETAYTIADTGEPSGPVKYLPFWILETKIITEAETGTDPFSRFFIPAFRYRRLKMLSDLAKILSKKQPTYSDLKNQKPQLHGCYYDQEDAAMLAQFIHAGSDKKSLEAAQSEKMPFHVKNAILTWFPFREKAGGLVDPFVGFSLPQSLLI